LGESEGIEEKGGGVEGTKKGRGRERELELRGGSVEEKRRDK